MPILNPPADYTKRNRTSRARGYLFENKLVKEFDYGPWQARRLGGSSTGLPDLVITNNKESILVALEAKSTVSNHCYVPRDQIERCNEVLKMFNVYRNQNIVLAFKFGNPLKRGRIKYYYFIFGAITENIDHIHSLRCDANGKITTISNNPDKRLWYYHKSDYIGSLKLALTENPQYMVNGILVNK